MAKVRSPRYPQISLPEAIEKIREVYNSDHLNRIPKEVVASHMGYSGLHGKSLGVISAVIKFGLLSGPSSGMQVTSRALDILVHEKGTPERAKAVAEAARSPALFHELLEEYPNGASDQTIKSYLLSRKKFLPTAVSGAIHAFRDTLTFLQEESGSDSIDSDRPEENIPPRRDSAVGASAVAKWNIAGAEGRSESDAVRSDSSQKVEPRVATAHGPTILFDMESVTISGSFKTSGELRGFMNKLEKLVSLLPDSDSDKDE